MPCFVRLVHVFGALIIATPFSHAGRLCAQHIAPTGVAGASRGSSDTATTPATTPETRLASALARTGHVAVPLRSLIFTSLYTVPVHIGSTEEFLIFDSGFGGMVNLDKAFADSLGITGSPYMTLVGVGGEGAMTDSTRLGGIVLGTLPLDTQAITIIPNLRTHVPAAGAIGAVLLGRYSGVIDYAHSTLYLRRPDATKVPELPAVAETQGAKAIPLVRSYVETPRPAATYSIRAIINGKPAFLLLDTGASVSVLDQAFADALHIPTTESPVAATGVSGQQSMRVGTANRVVLGDVTLDGVSIITTDLTAPNQREKKLGLPSVDGIIGVDILSKLGAVVDFGHNVLYLHPPTTP